MWLGLLYDAYDDALAGVNIAGADAHAVNDDPGGVVLYAWGPRGGGPTSISCTVSAAPDSARILRNGDRGGVPRCGACGTAFDLPLD